MKTNNENEKYFNKQAVEGNLKSKDHYDDLPNPLNEMLREIKDEKAKEMIVQNINTYYDSLNSFLIKHVMEHPRI